MQGCNVLTIYVYSSCVYLILGYYRAGYRPPNMSGAGRIIERELTNRDILRYVREWGIPNFAGVFMRDTIPHAAPSRVECGIVNLNLSTQPGSHWVAYYKDGTSRLYFDSYGQHTPDEVERYLKTRREYKEGVECIVRNCVRVQKLGTTECGGLCLYVLALLCRGWDYANILLHLRTRLRSTHAYPGGDV